MTNKYFDLYYNPAEELLYSDLINETINIFGVDCYYMPRTSESSLDLLFGEDPTAKFGAAYPIEVYVQSVDNFEGGELFSKFGLEVRKQARFLLATRAFKKVFGSQYDRPREGDLIWMKNFNALFEIKFADEEHFFYTFGNTKIYGYSLVCEKFRYSNERIATEIPEIDDTMANITPAFAYTMSNVNASGSYQLGELVYQPNANGTVVSWDVPSLTLVLQHVNGTFLVNTNIVGANSLASWTCANTKTLDDINRHLDNNLDIQAEANAVLSWSEDNPFGIPT